jgi:AcrR family transcriptional regulator
MESKTKPKRDGARRRLTLSGRIALADGAGVTPQLISDVCEQAGVPPQSFRLLYSTDDAFLDAVQESVALECAQRLRSSFAEIRGLDDAQTLQAAAVALARSRPIDRGAVIIRAERRLRALRSPNDANALLAAEHRQLDALSAVVAELIGQLGRDALWPTSLAARIIIETYERSFEAWVFGGGDERDFHTSSYVTRTLPTLLGRMTAPIARTVPVTAAA